MKAFGKTLVAVLFTATSNCGEHEPVKTVSRLWFYTSDDPHQQVTDSTTQLEKHDEHDSLIGEGSFVEGGMHHSVKAYSNGHRCPPHACAVFVELDAIGSFYLKPIDGGGGVVWRSNSDSLNQLIHLALQVSRADSFLLTKRYAPYFLPYNGSTDSIPSLADVDSIPQFPGGYDSLTAYLQKEIHYPDAEFAAGVRGKVYVRFIVNESGRISDIEVLRRLSPGFDAEVFRAVGSMPAWSPASIGGKPVKCRLVLPIQFDLKDKQP